MVVEHRVAVDVGVLDHEVVVRRHERAVREQLVEHVGLPVVRVEDHHQAVAVGAPAHVLEECGVGRRAEHVLDPRVLGPTLELLGVDGDHVAVVDRVADGGEEERAAAVCGAGLDDEVGTHPHDDLLVHPEVGGHLPRGRGQPRRVAPGLLGVVVVDPGEDPDLLLVATLRSAPDPRPASLRPPSAPMMRAETRRGRVRFAR